MAVQGKYMVSKKLRYTLSYYKLFSSLQAHLYTVVRYQIADSNY